MLLDWLLARVSRVLFDGLPSATSSSGLHRALAASQIVSSAGRAELDRAATTINSCSEMFRVHQVFLATGQQCPNVFANFEPAKVEYLTLALTCRFAGVPVAGGSAVEEASMGFLVS